MIKTKIKEKVYQLGKIKGQVILILKENEIISIKIGEIITEGIMVIITKVLNLNILSVPKTQHKKNS